MDISKIRSHFPQYKENQNLIYLDNAASSLKPKEVIDKIDYYYNHLSANVERAVYSLSYEATCLYEEARQNVAKLINSSEEEIVFTRGASNSLNLVASSYGMENVLSGDEVVTTILEHHSSFLPWINVCKKKGATIKYIPLDENNKITVENFKNVLTNKTKVVAITYVSNVLGYISPIKEIVELAHSVGAVVSLDAAQAIPHMKIDVKDLDVDFMSFSGHKMMGPSGIGVLYGKKELLEKMSPIEFGGGMVDYANFDSMTFKSSPYKFETGTPIISGAIGLGEAAKILMDLDLEEIADYEKKLAQKAIELLETLDGVEIYNKNVESGIVTFNIDGVHPHDTATSLDSYGVCVRAGHHCAQLITRHLQQNATVRASFYLYNDENDVLALYEAVKKTIKFFKGV